MCLPFVDFMILWLRGENGTGPAKFNIPHSVTVDSTGRVNIWSDLCVWTVWLYGGGACINIYGSWCTYACLHTWMCVCVLVNVCISGHLGCSSRTGYTHVLSYIALQPWAHVTRNHFTETSLAIQSLALHAANTGGAGLIPGWGTGNPHAIWGSQKMKKKSKPKNKIYFTVCMPWVVYIKPSTLNVT